MLRNVGFGVLTFKSFGTLAKPRASCLWFEGLLWTTRGCGQWTSHNVRSEVPFLRFQGQMGTCGTLLGQEIWGFWLELTPKKKLSRSWILGKWKPLSDINPQHTFLPKFVKLLAQRCSSILPSTAKASWRIGAWGQGRPWCWPPPQFWATRTVTLIFFIGE